MDKLIKYISLSFVLLLFGCGTDWKENYNEKSKDPFGEFIIKKELKILFKTELKTLDKNICEELLEIENNDIHKEATYICIKDNTSKFTTIGVEKLKKFAKQGNHIFISFNEFPNKMKKAFDFTTSKEYSGSDSKSESGKLYLKNKSLKPKAVFYDRNLQKTYFDSFDKKLTVVLGTNYIKGKHRPNFIKINYGEGAIFLHSTPIVFTNYFLLKKKNAAYASNVFSYIKESNEIWWDELSYKCKLEECCCYKKKEEEYKYEYKNEYTDDEYVNNEENNTNECEDNQKKSILNFFWNNPSLKWSLIVGFLGILGFIFFNLKRKQRVIPELPILKNMTTEFTHTIANLYFEENNPKNLVDKKILFFLHEIRVKYSITTTNLDDNFISRLASKSGNSINKTKQLITFIINLKNSNTCTEESLIRLNTQIDDFLQ